MGKIDLKDVTFIIPVRIDSLERLDNLVVVTDYILSHCNTHISVLEADHRNTGILKKLLNPDIEIFFEEDSLAVFHRTHYINELVKRANTRHVAVWDADVMVAMAQIESAVEILRNDAADMVIPYNGKFLNTGTGIRDAYFSSLDIALLYRNINDMQMLFGAGACGGGFFVNKNKYCMAGMENEYFFGWGVEDGERVRRFEIMGLKILKVNSGPMFHFTHPRKINSNFRSAKAKEDSLKEYLRITSMTREELQNEISMWFHIKNLINDQTHADIQKTNPPVGS
jgi:predicted glycosyltransferase involved in capsule biosynthesis